MSETQTIDRPKGKAKQLPSGGFAIERDSFLGAIRTVGQVVENRVTIPILSNLLIRVGGGTMTIVGTDLEMLVEANADCASAGPVATTVSSDRLASAVETLRPGMIEAELEGFQLVLKQGSARRRLPTLPAEDFPVIKVGDIQARFEIEAGRLLSIFDATSPAVSTEETRYYLNGVFFHSVDGYLRGVATDGHRLARMSVPLPEGAAGMPDIIVARKSVRELRRLLQTFDGQAMIPVEVGTGKMTFKLGSTRLVAKLIDGTFPDYTRVIPTANKKLLTVHSTEWARCIRAAGAVCTERTRGVRLDLSAGGCEAIGQSPEGGKADDPMDAEFSDDAVFSIGLNSRYAVDISTMFGEAATLKLAFDDAAAPILITSDDKPALTAVLMPMRV